MNVLDWFLLALVGFAAALALRRIWQDRRAGKCCGSCAACTAGCALRATRVQDSDVRAQGCVPGAQSRAAHVQSCAAGAQTAPRNTREM